MEGIRGASGRPSSADHRRGSLDARSLDYYGWAEQVSGTGQGGRLHTLATGNFQNLTYTYDKVGNITQIVDAHSSETSSYAYDSLNRLTSWSLNGTPDNYTYDATTGNLATKGTTTYTYNSGHAHAVSSRSDGSSFQYDANGNMTQRVVGGQTFNLGYDAENRLVSVSGAISATFFYDGDGNRVKSTFGGTTHTYFVGNIYEKTGSTETKYYYAGAARVAMRQGTTLYYLLSDHLGSTTVTTDASGNVVSELRYNPWGEVRSGTAPTKYTYTGQYSNVSDFGLLFYNARWLDPSLGRFASADTIVPPGAQGPDRYAYVGNSPVNYTDPSGHYNCEGESGSCTRQSHNEIVKFYRDNLKEKFSWTASRDYGLRWLKLIYQVGMDILWYANSVTDGKGLAWMRANLGGTYFAQGGAGAPWYVPDHNGSAFPGWASGTGKNTVFLPPDLFSANYVNLRQYVAHELGHVWDMNTGKTGPLGTSGGVGDSLNARIMGGVVAPLTLRWLNLKINEIFIPRGYLYSGRARDGYGNGCRADYLAEAFGWRVYDRSKLPNLEVQLWVDELVMN